MDPVAHRLVGYDIDFANAIVKHIGARSEFVPTYPGNRIQLLQSGRVDLIVAYVTITPARAKVVDFSIPYFQTGVKLLVRCGRFDPLRRLCL